MGFRQRIIRALGNRPKPEKKFVLHSHAEQPIRTIGNQDSNTWMGFQPIVQGSDYNNRVGNEIRIKKLYINLWCYPNVNATAQFPGWGIVRVVVVKIRDTMDQANLPAVDLLRILLNTSSLTMYRPKNFKNVVDPRLNFKILADKQFNFQSRATLDTIWNTDTKMSEQVVNELAVPPKFYVWKKSFRWRKGLKVTFADDDSISPVQNGLFLFTFASIDSYWESTLLAKTDFVDN